MNEKERTDGVSASDAVTQPLADESGDERANAKARLLAQLPARLRPSPSVSDGQDALQRAEVDPKVEGVVRKWLEIKESRGVVITQDLRKRHWYKSPDMMMSMLHKFGIDDRGTLLDIDMRGLTTRTEARALWEEYEMKRSKEREHRKGGKSDGAVAPEHPKIEFTGSKQAAVQAALQAAREHAAKKSGTGHSDGRHDVKRRKR